MIVVKKKDDSPRVCIDYRPLNRIIERDRHPLPLIEDRPDRQIKGRPSVQHS